MFILYLYESLAISSSKNYLLIHDYDLNLININVSQIQIKGHLMKNTGKKLRHFSSRNFWEYGVDQYFPNWILACLNKWTISYRTFKACFCRSEFEYWSLESLLKLNIPKTKQNPNIQFVFTQVFQNWYNKE